MEFSSMLKKRQSDNPDKSGTHSRHDETMPKRHGMKILSFYLNGDIYAVALPDIKEVNKVFSFRKVPKAPDCIAGVFNLHGSTTALLNTKRLLDIAPFEIDSSSQWIGSRLGDSLICFAVDQLHRIMVVDLTEIDEVPTQAKVLETGYIKGCARVDDLIIPVLDLPQLLDAQLAKAIVQLPKPE
jgi:purine-binding chemotaxis protein CheW